MRTPPFDVILQQLVNSVNGISKLYGQHDDEDIIDYLHRLAKSGLSAERISELSGVPYVSVEYWMHSNGYDCDDQLAASGVRVRGVLARG